MFGQSEKLGTLHLVSIVFANVLMLVSLWYSASNNSPLFDEPAHFASGVILAYHCDAGNFRVNPPVNKWITAVSVLFAREMKLPFIIASSQYGNHSRPEFELNIDYYLSLLICARYARILMMLIGSFLLYIATATLPPSRRILCQVFWCTSPILLGHGWVVSADAPAAIAMCLILVTTDQLWKSQASSKFFWSGIAWGVAIGTKFTFGPLYLIFIPIFYICLPRQANCQVAKKPVASSWLWGVGNWVLHGAIASIILNALYCFDLVGVPIGSHDFISQFFREFIVDPKSTSDAISRVNWATLVPSPFPKVFLEGVDQQMADMDYPRGAYWMGERIHGPIYWFHLAGYFAKEQIAVWLSVCLALIAALVATFRPRVELDPFRTPILKFCLLTILGFGCFMTTQCNLVWNIRYLTPSLPLIYVFVAGAIPKMGLPIRSRTPNRFSDAIPLGIAIIAIMEFLWCFPHFFSYTNPCFGGSHRVPMALNDSNFDYGQDLFYLRRWVARQNARRTVGLPMQVYGVLSGHGEIWLSDFVKPANNQMLESVLHRLERRTEADQSRSLGNFCLVLSRGLSHPEPWALRYSNLTKDPASAVERQNVSDLLLYHQPDIFITPTLVVYYLPEDR
jgi:hypothetical protein